MNIDAKIMNEKLQYNINGEVAKTSTLSSGKTDKYEYLTSDKMLSSNHREIIQQAMFRYFPSRKVLEKQLEKQVHDLNSLTLFQNK